MDEIVYHSSQRQGLEVIEPKESTHGEKWVYATKDLAASAVFLSGIGGDFTCSIGRDPLADKIYVCERFAGALDYRYKGKAGSIYTLPADSFEENRTQWEEEVVSQSAVKPIAESRIHDAQEYLLNLKREGKLIIKCYPDKIANIPSDDEDLVQRGIHWTNKFGNRILEQIKFYHSHLLERVVQGLDKSI